mmetsp:Transcript_48606/g.90200  ORF Transcript_48606/g.90200 Transcript_48606/m.90200 type:complete len:86 (+) Transcript_48606:136-393(+)
MPRVRIFITCSLDIDSDARELPLNVRGKVVSKLCSAYRGGWNSEHGSQLNLHSKRTSPPATIASGIKCHKARFKQQRVMDCETNE